MFLRFALLAVFNIIGGLSSLVAIVAGLDWLADGITLFTNAGDIASLAALIAVLAYAILFIVGFVFVARFDKWG